MEQDWGNGVLQGGGRGLYLISILAPTQSATLTCGKIKIGDKNVKRSSYLRLLQHPTTSQHTQERNEAHC
jgi:hypothetical protein